MKTKKFNKKLSLNKKTIANLGNNELNYVLGGYPTDARICKPTTQCTGGCVETDYSCPPCDTWDTCTCYGVCTGVPC
jgi:natural product precursor